MCVTTLSCPLVYLTDDGYAPDPMVFLFAQQQSNGDLWIIDEMYLTRCLYEQALSYVCQTRPNEYGQDEASWMYQVQEWEDGVGPRPTGEVREYKQPSSAYGGATDTQLRAHLSKFGIRVMAPTKTRVLEGIAEVRKMVRDANGHRGLVFHPRCKNAIRDFTLYHRRRG